jgi:hypothetical protein
LWQDYLENKAIRELKEAHQKELWYRMFDDEGVYKLLFEGTGYGSYTEGLINRCNFSACAVQEMPMTATELIARFEEAVRDMKELEWK